MNAYERTFPVSNYALDACGTTHIQAGNGGNGHKVGGGTRVELSEPIRDSATLIPVPLLMTRSGLAYPYS